MWAPYLPSDWAPYVPFDPISDEDEARSPAKGGGGRGGKKRRNQGVAGQETNIGIKAGMGHGGKHAIKPVNYAMPKTTGKTMTSNFQVKFNKGFEWGCRGKVGGMFIGEGKASGGRHTEGAASARLMWDKDGGAFANVYVPQGTQGRQRPDLQSVGGKYGARAFRGDFKNAFSTDKWNDVQMSVTLNDPGQANGKLSMTINGKKRTMDGIMWRTGNQQFNQFTYNAFHGGGCMATRDSNMAVRAPTFSTGEAGGVEQGPAPGGNLVQPRKRR